MTLLLVKACGKTKEKRARQIEIDCSEVKELTDVDAPGYWDETKLVWSEI